MTSSRSLYSTTGTLARSLSRRTVPVIAAAALLVVAVSGCGINITPPQADSSTVDTADDPGATPAMPIASAGGNSGMQAAMSGGQTPGMNSGADPSAAMGAAMHGSPGDSSAGDPTADMEATMTAEMHGAAGDETGVNGEYSQEDIAAMMEQEQAGGAGLGAGDGLTPEQMQEEMAQGQRGAGRNPGAQIPDADDAEFDQEGAGGGGGRSNQFEEGTPAHIVMLMVEAIDDGDMETAAKYIGDDADGLLGSVRDGDAGQNQLSQLQSYFATMDPIRARPSGRSITLTFNGGQNKVLSFVVAKEGRDFVVDSLTVRDAQDRRGR